MAFAHTEYEISAKDKKRKEEQLEVEERRTWGLVILSIIVVWVVMIPRLKWAVVCVRFVTRS